MNERNGSRERRTEREAEEQKEKERERMSTRLSSVTMLALSHLWDPDVKQEIVWYCIRVLTSSTVRKQAERVYCGGLFIIWKV